MCRPHSLPVIGLKMQGATKLCVQTLRHLRAVAKAPAHITHESNASLLKVPLPLRALQKRWARVYMKHQTSKDAMVHDPLILKWLEDVGERLRSRNAGSIQL